MINGAAMNLQLGKMYLVKQYFWLLYPTKELARERAGMDRAWASREAKYFSEHYKCNVSVVEENTYVVLLEQDKNFCFKVFDSNGNIGWIRCTEFSVYFELVKE